MNTRVGLCVAFGILIAPLAAHAGQATVVLDIHHAYCQLCPTIVKKTLEHVDGVMSVAVGQVDADGNMLATVRYDDARGSPAAMIKAATDQGYPAEVSGAPSG
jgi:mercuric ion binding protein